MATLFHPFEKQEILLKEILKFEKKYFCYGGAAGGGKSFAGLGSMLTLLVLYPGSKAIVVRDTYPNLQQTSIESWKKLIRNEIGRDSFITAYNQTERIFYCANGSQIQFIAEDFDNKKDLAHFMGLEFNFCLLEEAGGLQEATFHKCIERCGRWLPNSGFIPPPVIILTTNPTSNFVRRIFYDPFVANTLPKDYFYLPALISDNKYLQENTAYIESTKQMPSVQYRRYILGDWNVEEPAEGRIYRMFDPDKAIGITQYNPELPLHISFDENVNPFITLLVFQIVGKSVFLIDEILGRHPLNTVEGICTLFKKNFPSHNAGIYLYGDASSNKKDTKIETGFSFYTLIEGHLRKYKPLISRVMKSNPNVLLRTSWIDAIFEKGVGDMFITLDTHCNETINDFLSTQTASDGSKLKNIVRDPQSKISYQAHGHCTDAFEYMMCSAFPKEFDAFKRGNRPWIPPKVGKNPPSRNTYDSQAPVIPIKIPKPYSKHRANNF